MGSVYGRVNEPYPPSVLIGPCSSNRIHPPHHQDDLHQVQHRRPQVQQQPPDQKRPAARQHDPAPQRIPLSQQHQRESRHQRERRGLADVGDGQRRQTATAQHGKRRGEHGVTAQKRQHEPPRHRAVERERDRDGHHVDAIHQRVEQLAEPRRLVGDQPGDLAVGPVGETAEHQDRDGPALRVRDQQQVQEHGHQQQAHEAQHVGYRQHPVAPLVRRRHRAPAPGSRRVFHA
ncbi:hypothetical protein MSMEG_3653 [Mycolicibacterium smegmatis MC2 155]|uniref:Uncharacterized protein n=1 Tax=Mycolicibacterium smegmatis (strain ATCC 700084 / mc(2)155) TaxID=246196 RepID=A0QYG7_MYCS2|nr:hypothetical protein MSMEG_3653 [Mycolicibacterium smegmatis MC2 155]